MNPVYLICISITLIVVAIICVCYWSNFLNKKRARRIEVAGYVLLIVVAVWGFGIKNVMFGEFYNDDWFYLNQKLHYIFNGIATLHNGMEFDTSSAWEHFNAAVSTEFVDKQLFQVDCIEACFQVVSALCIAIGRLHDLIKPKSTKCTCRKYNKVKPRPVRQHTSI